MHGFIPSLEGTLAVTNEPQTVTSFGNPGPIIWPGTTCFPAKSLTLFKPFSSTIAPDERAAAEFSHSWVEKVSQRPF